MGFPCVSHSPAFHPKFESLSDEELDVCEILALGLIMGIPIWPWTEAIIDGATALTECFQHMTARQKREYEIWWVLYLTNCTTDAEMRDQIRLIMAKTTPDERKAILTGMRTSAWDYAQCVDLP